MRALLVSIALSLAACSPAAPPAAQNVPTAAPATLTASGEPQALTPLASEANIQWAASVTRVDDLQNAGGKVFGLAGGDPAMNGLYTQLAFFLSPADGWRVFRIGDFLDYRVLSDSPGGVDLEISESVLNNQTGEIGSQTRHLIVTWTPGADGAAPESIHVTPATASN